MKITKTPSGKTEIRISQGDWIAIGATNKWINKFQINSSILATVEMADAVNISTAKNILEQHIPKAISNPDKKILSYIVAGLYSIAQGITINTGVKGSLYKNRFINLAKSISESAPRHLSTVLNETAQILDIFILQNKET